MNKIKELMSYVNPEIAIVAIPVVLYISYKLALELWCVAYGLIY